MTAVSYQTDGGSAPENYESYFVPAIGEPLARELVDRAALRPGERVLDVACGTGVVARLAAQQVGPAGSVAGLDSNPGMLGVARSVTPDVASGDWYEASAESMPLPDDAVDVVLCQIGLQFMDDRAAAAREMRRVLAPGGRLLLTVPGPTPAPFAVFAEELADVVAPQVAMFVHAVFSLHDPDELRGLLTDAGLADVIVEQRTRTLSLPPPQHFLWQYIHSTPMAAALAQTDDDTRATLEDRVVSRWQPFVEDGALVVQVPMVTAIARSQ